MRRALVSVSDKTGLVDFVKGLKDLGWEIIATGGTRRLLEESGVGTVGISDVTGFPEILDGRVKTLHPKVHGGILARRDIPGHMKTLEEQGIGTIDLVRSCARTGTLPTTPVSSSPPRPTPILPNMTCASPRTCAGRPA